MTKRAYARPGERCAKFLGIAAYLIANLTMASDAVDQIIDCPLRDASYSVESPVMDIMLNENARAVMDAALPGLLDKLPPSLMRAEPPSLAATMSIRSMTAMMRMPEGAVDFESLDNALSNVVLTPADKAALCVRYDDQVPEMNLDGAQRQVLIFTKVTGYDHGPATTAATEAIRSIANELGWGVTVTHKAGVFTPQLLQAFDVVVWNNNSGDVLTLSQRKAFEQYIEAGGGYLGVHGSGGDFIYLWEWYVNTLLGAQFIGHTMAPHFQDARIEIENNPAGIGIGLQQGWNMNEEWYSFAQSPRVSGATVVARLDENTYTPDMGGQSLRMGDDHPIVWTRCVNKGRSLYTGIGHRPESYDVPENLSLLKDALLWTAGEGTSRCEQGRNVTFR